MVAQRLTVVVPALNEAAEIERCLGALAPLRARGHEVIVVDGGSSDATARLAAPLADRVIDAPRGRAAQMNKGAAAASGDALLFLHADTRLPPEADRLVGEALRGHAWGRFDVAIDSDDPRLAVIAFFINRRSRLSGIATGDQAIFVRRDAFPGFAPIALMEDIAFSRAMKQVSPPACLTARVLTSARRWERRGVARTVLLMWRLRYEYWRGADPDELARRYSN
ncbi:MAG: TIGR04283 family arsenosugar biosynthesis glycosyltransferase [Betaproteobacteria bacterium]|nr:TIGR04283 family arsenosugar biosynthesis glycosyltransferase [Betaproteobacteria bacterium]MDH4322590.1 TIGR04283 family arsenosugar biosynthesis glycosyltransferase [Betaproteobacteria bacterium]MDH5576843.1 TIGR04283 family arsenosugar biosynthesis glycosyltransferase [Betaproteobacteria bacterium]